MGFKTYLTQMYPEIRSAELGFVLMRATERVILPVKPQDEDDAQGRPVRPQHWLPSFQCRSCLKYGLSSGVVMFITIFGEE